MLHQVMNAVETATFREEGTCPRGCYRRLKAGINLKEGWWLCVDCDTWWQPAPR